MTTHASTSYVPEEPEEGQRGIDIHTRDDSENIILVFSMGSSRYVLPLNWEEADTLAQRLTEVAAHVGVLRQERLKTYD